jgi:hypothetical protein
MDVNGQSPDAKMNAWAALKVIDLIRRAALLGASELQDIAKRAGLS